LCVFSRDSLGGQLQLALAKADSEQLARTIAEEQLSDVEKEKTMLELEIKEILSRQKSELSKKDHVITMVGDAGVFCVVRLYCNTNLNGRLIGLKTETSLIVN